MEANKYRIEIHGGWQTMGYINNNWPSIVGFIEDNIGGAIITASDPVHRADGKMAEFIISSNHSLEDTRSRVNKIKNYIDEILSRYSYPGVESDLVIGLILIEGTGEVINPDEKRVYDLMMESIITCKSKDDGFVLMMKHALVKLPDSCGKTAIEIREASCKKLDELGVEYEKIIG
jgi:hypothetical protein